MGAVTPPSDHAHTLSCPAAIAAGEEDTKLSSSTPVPASRRLPPEIVSVILTFAGDWELANALGVHTRLPTSSPWIEFATPLDRAILRSLNSPHSIPYALAHGQRTFTQWGARVMIRFALIPALEKLWTGEKRQFEERVEELLPVVASAWGRKDVLEWALAREGGMRPDARTTAEAVDEASRHGQVDMLDFWLNSGLPLHYSEAALSSATIKRQVPTLEWWKKSGLKLKIGNVLDFASMEGSDVCLEWWSQSGLPCKYTKAALYSLSKSGNLPLLAWWRSSRFPLAYDKEVLIVATRYARVDVLEWWGNSGLDVEFRFFDVEEALEDCVGCEVEKEKVQDWWEKRGYDTIMGANSWMRMRGLRSTSQP